MPERLQEWQRQIQLRRQRRLLEKHYAPLLDAAKKRFDKDRITADWEFKEEYIETELAVLLHRQAERWGVEIPDDVLVESQYEDGVSCIGASYQPSVKRQIIEARRKTIKFWAWWIGPGGVVLGVIRYLIS